MYHGRWLLYLLGERDGEFGALKLLHEAGGDEVEGLEAWVAVCGGGGGRLHLPCGWNFPLLPQVNRGSTFASRRPNSRLLSR